MPSPGNTPQHLMRLRTVSPASVQLTEKAMVSSSGKAPKPTLYGLCPLWEVLVNVAINVQHFLRRVDLAGWQLGFENLVELFMLLTSENHRRASIDYTRLEAPIHQVPLLDQMVRLDFRSESFREATSNCVGNNPDHILCFLHDPARQEKRCRQRQLRGV